MCYLKEKAFTLFELIIVMVIISSMVAIIVPLAGRSRENLKIDQLCSDIQQAINYAINLANTENCQTKFTINKKLKYFNITKYQDQSFTEIQGPAGINNYFDQKISIANEDGVVYQKDEFNIVFDSTKSWPEASFSVYNSDVEYYLKIEGKNVKIQKTE